MKPVRDDTGTHYLLLKSSEETSLVRDPDTGTERYIQNDQLEPVDESPLETAARTVEEPVRTLLTAVHDEQTLGLLVELDERGPIGVRTLLADTEFCESDLHGRLTVLTAAGLITECAVAGERGYESTDVCAQALEIVRGDAGSNAEPDD